MIVVVSGTEDFGEGVDMTSNVIPSTPLTQPTIVEKHTPPILLSYSPKGSQQWIRKVEEDFTPRVGMKFNTLEDGIQFYRIYAIACGFDIRKSSQRRFRDQTIRTKHIVCHREGFRESKKMKKLENTEADETTKGKSDNNKGKCDNKKERVTTIRRFGCTYVICQFCEGHNHPLVLVKNREFQKFSRNLTLYHKQTIINHSKINIGASKTYKIWASLLDFKNFQREVKLFIGDADAEMFINNLEKLVHSKKGFQYAYHVDEGRNLSRVFWTDAHGKYAYLAFGDGVSFDPTYGTNKYYMVFTPFTGIDNHKKSVTFVCALLSNEDEESFVLVFEKFMDAMGRKEPQIIITDQDPAIRNAVPTVFKTARHRFCLWHIMNKVADKIDIITRKETDFLSRLNGVVWNQDLEPTEFEVINEFGLGDNRWLSTIFDVREYWIPAYLETCIWRHTHKHLEMESNNSVPKTIIPLSLESHALTVYTHEVFYEIQEEIKSSMCGCGIVGYSRSASLEMTSIEDSQRSKTFAVQYNALTNDVLCTCKLFERKGLICRHIFWVFSNKLLKTIPEKYILTRWSKNALRGPIYDLNGNIIENYDTADESQLEMSKVWSEFYNAISVVAKKEADVLRDMQRVLREFKDTVEPAKEKMSKRQEMKMLIGCSTPDEVRILPPRHSKNKGSGKRIVTSKNKAIEKKLIRVTEN
ncbi:hypothetical protein RND81_10G108400 [Saponaria officinalis]|uniref:SWIM-type domain-containing protein n=1 Tax=Saponaria officinalis TaxID=3572 RepID=A0AAW1I152_SAPOF